MSSSETFVPSVHGVGKLLVPLVVRRQAQKEVPRNQQKLKERLEKGA